MSAGACNRIGPDERLVVCARQFRSGAGRREDVAGLHPFAQNGTIATKINAVFAPAVKADRNHGASESQQTAAS